jgi:hypothetical protein
MVDLLAKSLWWLVVSAVGFVWIRGCVCREVLGLEILSDFRRLGVSLVTWGGVPGWLGSGVMACLGWGAGWVGGAFGGGLCDGL